MDSNVREQEMLARFIFSSSHFSRETKRVKHNAFLPTPEGKSSAFRTQDLSEQEIWIIGDDVARKRDQKLYGRGDILTQSVIKAGLDVAPDEPPPRQANIINWPADKGAQKLRAIELAGAAKLVLNS